MALPGKNNLNVLITDILILITVAVYSAIRYYLNEYRIPNPDIIYFINKGLAISAAISISISYLIGNLSKLNVLSAGNHTSKAKYFGVYGFFTASIHILISLMLLNPVRFKYLYQANGNFNYNGEMTILFGVMAFALFIMPGITTIPSVKNAMTIKSWKNYQQIGYIGSLILFFHILSVDYVNISRPNQWKYYLIPISLIAWVFIISSIIIKIIILFKERKSKVKI